MQTVHRRGFNKKTGAATAGVTLGVPAYIKGYAQKKPSETINVAVVGVNGRGGKYSGGTGHASGKHRLPYRAEAYF